MIRQFVEEYREAFARYDRDALLEFFSFPLQLISLSDNATSTSIFNGEDWPDVLDGLLRSYSTIGVAEGKVLEVNVTELPPRLSSVRVHWELRRDDGSAIYDFTAIYTLVQIDGGWRVVAIAHDELPRLQAALASKSGP